MTSTRSEPIAARRLRSAPPRAALVQSTDHWDRRTWGIILVLCGALFLDALDVSMIGIALPSIGHALELSASKLQWVVSAYVLGYGGFLLLGGRAADLLGRRTVFLVALAAFAVMSVSSAVVSDGSLLIASRFLKGASAAFTAPAALSLITTTFEEGPARTKALLIFSGVAALGFSLGLVIGGVLTEASWRLVFLMPAPLAVLLLFMGPRVLPKAERLPTRLRHFDIAGALSITTAMLLLVYSVVEAPQRGWTSAATLGGFAGTLLLLSAFVTIERRTSHPLVRLGILRVRALVDADLGTMLFFGSFIGYQFFGTLYMQDHLGWSPIETALAFLPCSAILPILGSQGEALIARFGTSRLIFAGLVSFIAGLLLFLRASGHPSYVVGILPSMFLIGLGWGLGFPSMNVQATASVADKEQGLASGLLNTSIELGAALGVAIAGAVIAANTHTVGGSESGIGAALSPTIVAVAVMAGIGLLITAVSIFAPGRSAQPLTPLAET